MDSELMCASKMSGRVDNHFLKVCSPLPAIREDTAIDTLVSAASMC